MTRTRRTVEAAAELLYGLTLGLIDIAVTDTVHNPVWRTAAWAAAITTDIGLIVLMDRSVGRLHGRRRRHG